MFKKKIGRPSNNTLRKRKIFIISASFIVLIIITSLATITYARYKTNSQANATVDIAKWNISFKDGSGSILSQTTNAAFTPSSTSYVASGKIAPYDKLSTTVQIDPLDTEVAVDYYISIPKSALNMGGNNSLTLATVTATTNGVTTNLTINDTTVNNVDVFKTNTATIPLTAISTGNGLTSLVITLQWTNSGDNAASVTESSLDIPVTLFAQQHLSIDN